MIEVISQGRFSDVATANDMTAHKVSCTRALEARVLSTSFTSSAPGSQTTARAKLPIIEVYSKQVKHTVPTEVYFAWL